MSIISYEQADRLYWLGRYSERVYTTIRLYFESYDGLIDGSSDLYRGFCRSIDIPDVYGSMEIFEERYPFDSADPNSIMSNLTRAYDNAIELRDEIGSEVISYIQLAIYAMNKAKASQAPLIQLQKVVDNIVSFWGMVDDDIDNEHVRSIIKLGKRIERIDLYARMKMDPVRLRREMKRLNTRINRTGLKYNTMKLAHLNYLVEMSEIPNDLVVEEIESLFDDEERKTENA